MNEDEILKLVDGISHIKYVKNYEDEVVEYTFTINSLSQLVNIIYEKASNEKRPN